MFCQNRRSIMVRDFLFSRLKKGPAAVLSLCCLLFSACALPATGQDGLALSGLQRLEKQVRDVIRGKEGEVGVALLHVETGRELAVNGDTLFPMASTFKIPILVEVLYQVREARFAMDEEVRVEKPISIWEAECFRA
jgi:beta-lactamase class A